MRMQQKECRESHHRALAFNLLDKSNGCFHEWPLPNAQFFEQIAMRGFPLPPRRRRLLVLRSRIGTLRHHGLPGAQCLLLATYPWRRCIDGPTIRQNPEVADERPKSKKCVW